MQVVEADEALVARIATARKARSGQLINVRGIDSPYEAPEAPEVHLDTTLLTPEDAADAVVRQLTSMGVIPESSAT